MGSLKGIWKCLGNFGVLIKNLWVIKGNFVAPIGNFWANIENFENCGVSTRNFFLILGPNMGFFRSLLGSFKILGPSTGILEDTIRNFQNFWGSCRESCVSTQKVWVLYRKCLGSL